MLTADFDFDLPEEPALFLVWDRTSPAIRDAVTLRAAFDDAVERVRTRRGKKKR